MKDCMKIMKKGEILTNDKGIEAIIVDIVEDWVEVKQSNGYRFQIKRRDLQKEIRSGKLRWKKRLTK